MQPTQSKYDIGSIYLLPAYDKIPLEHLYATVLIDFGCFNHPVLILWVNPSETEAIVSIITSFGGTDLLRRHPYDIRARSLHLPIYPSNTHPDNGSRLFLRDDAQLSKNSYVKTEHQWTVKIVLLEPMRHGECTLKKRSYKELLRHIDFHPPVTKSHQKIRGTHNTSHGYGEWPPNVAPAVGGRVKPPPERRFAVHIQQALPPRQVRQPFTTPYLQHNAFNSSQAERTPLLQPAQPVPYIAHQRRTRETPSQAPDESCAVHFMSIVALIIFVWVVWWYANT